MKTSPPVNVQALVAGGVDNLVGWFGASGGLFHTSRAKNERWLAVARMVVELEVVFGEPLTQARTVLDQVLDDPWCQVTVGWDDL